MPKRYYTLKPQITPLPSAGKGVLPSDGANASGAAAEDGGASNASATASAAGVSGATPGGSGSNSDQPANDPFIRAEAEDDDGYDPYSDRPPTPEPTFQEDPWR